jgi:acyl-CoA thioesterase YciA
MTENSASTASPTPASASASAAEVATAETLNEQRGRDRFNEMNFHTRKWVRPEDLNANGTLFGGSLLRWIDDEAVVYAMIQLGNQRIVTKYLSEINFRSSATKGDIIEIGLQAIRFGRTSLTMRCEVRNIITAEVILSIDQIVFVGLDEDGNPKPHGFRDITYERDRFPEELRHRRS